MSDFTMLERDERWSLYFFYKNGAATLMFQLSQIKSAERGFAGSEQRDFPNLLYDYASRPYGLQWNEEADDARSPNVDSSGTRDGLSLTP